MRVFDVFGHETYFCKRERAMNDIKTVIDFREIGDGVLLFP